MRAAVARLIAELLHGDATHVELKRATGFADSTVRLWVQAFRGVQHRDMPRIIRITGWEKFGRNGGWKPVYGLNPDGLPDAPRPAKLSDAERAARMRQKQRERRLAATIGN